MALVEIELRAPEATNLVWFVLAKSPIPAPRLSMLGSSRLLSRPFAWQQPVLGDSIPGFAAPPSTLPLRAAVTVAHVSLDELKTSAAAPHALTQCMAWLIVSMQPDRLRIHLHRLEAIGGPTQTFATPLFIGEQLMPLDGVEDVRAAAILRHDEVVTLRFAVGADDDLLASPLNLLPTEPEDDGWLIRVAGDVFADRVRRQLAGAVSPPPSGTTVEASPVAVWAQFPLLSAGVMPGVAAGAWGVIGSVELEKADACADVDLSVTIGVTLSVSPDTSTRRVNLGLRVASDVSDWDVFRCWIGTGGIAGIIVGVVTNFVAGIMVALESLVMIAEFARIEAGTEVKSTSVGGGFSKAGSDDTSSWYTASVGLPSFPTGEIRTATVGPDGLVVRGGVRIFALDHTIAFEPDGGQLESHWDGHYSCREHRWKNSYEVQSVVVRDLIFAPDLSNPPARRLVAGNGVAVFPTTAFLPTQSGWLGPTTIAPGEWVYDAPAWATGSPIVTPRRTALPPVGEETYFFLHTSAGIRRFTIGPVGSAGGHDAPPAIILGAHEVNCKMTTRVWTRLQEIQWLIDPPHYDYGIRPLRQWMLTVRRLGPEASITVLTRGGPEGTGARHHFSGAETGVIEVVTSDDESLVLDHNLGDTDAEVRIVQRWLLPTHSARLPGPVQNLSLSRRRDGEVVATAQIAGRLFALGEDGLLEVGRARAVDGARKRRTRSVSMPGGLVTAIRGDVILNAVPYGAHERVVTAP